ncbi:MAG: phosphatase domain-containing protein [Pseudobdellovibrionaceae bacterium]
MADWRSRSTLYQDVAFFRYVPEGLEKHSEEVYIWDLDKTYLDTSWGTLSELLRTAVERAFNKKNVPGTKTLIQALQASWQEKRGNSLFPLYFITASPPQMEERIAEKLEHDKIRPFGCFFKDNLQNVRPGRFWRLTKQVGYKVQSLLQLRVRLRENAKQILWGDDSESDAVIYNLYSDICSRRISASEIRAVLKGFFVGGDQVDTILLLQSQIPENDPVEKIYINLAEDTDPDYYLKFGRRTVPTYNTFQTTLDCFQEKRLNLEHVSRIAQDMIVNYGFTPEELARSFDDLIRRQILAEATVRTLAEPLQKAGLITEDFAPSIAPIKSPDEESHEPWIPERIDYLHDYR